MRSGSEIREMVSYASIIVKCHLPSRQSHWSILNPFLILGESWYVSLPLHTPVSWFGLSRHSVQYAWGGETVASDILSGKSFTSWRDQAKGANKPRVDWKVLLWYNYVYDIKESIWKATWSCKTAVTLGHIQPHVNTGIQHFWKRKPARYYAKPCTAKLS